MEISINQAKLVALVLGPFCGALLLWIMVSTGWDWRAAFVAAVTLLCAVWWVSEAIPIPATSLLPLALFPLFGALTPTQVAQSYGDPIILLLMGGFILSTAMAKNNAHRRIALGLVRLIGGDSSRRIVIGFMLASALLSMWISNTATTLMLLPVAAAVIAESRDPRLSIPLLLGICYAASIGGIGTPIGTPPNLIFMKIYTETTGTEISFLAWMKWGLPVVCCLVPVTAWWLTRQLRGGEPVVMPALASWSVAEKRVMYVFGCTALAWMTRKEPFGGWSEWFNLNTANDASVALIAVVAMFLIPNGKGDKLLDWETANEIPWGMLLLFGGGIAIAKAFTEVGLGDAVAAQLGGLSNLPLWVLLLVICLVVTFVTEMTSNTATTTLLMPILAATALALMIDPALLMVPAAMSASCAFMLPVATAPNAIIFGSGKVPIRSMARNGLFLNIIGAVVISTLCYLMIA